ncbi:PEP-CTERM sorting domain-containing protein [Luteolibacter sp. Populi]|uniref:PEP-CTERM sorting domain-containing protein n=1 Tax=Luteolibacter sp. Populi TaxID=3230487 RepID=UPI0034664D63
MMATLPKPWAASHGPCSFFTGGSDFTTPITLPGVRFLIYDHDGEPGQSEAIRAFGSDGFAGYQLNDASGIGVQDEGDSWRFDAAGVGQSETGPGGGMILYYHDTSSIRFDMFSTTSPQLPAQNSGIFGAWDGNLGVNGGGTDGFGDFVPVPEPSTAVLSAMAAISLALRRRR